MPRMQVYLPDDLYKEVKERGLRASELLQKAVREAIRQEQLREEWDRYLDELAAEVGEPTPEEEAEAKELARAIEAHLSKSRPKRRGRRAG